MFDFISKRKTFGIISVALILITLVGSLIFGIKLNIDFKGGTILTYSYEGEIDADAVKSAVENALSGQSVKISTAYNNSLKQSTFVITLAASEGISADEQIAINKKLEETFPDNNIVSEDTNVVDSRMGKEFFAKALVALSFTSALLLIYIGFRFRKIGGWATGLTGIIALLHDVIMVFFTLLIFRFELDSLVMVVILTILGYSINDTIVIFDRLRENKRLLPRGTSDEELINVSLNQCFKRCLVTSITTISTMVVVTIVSLILSVNSVLSFTVPMIVGLVSGTYSSIYLTAVIWPWLNKFAGKKSKKKIKKA